MNRWSWSLLLALAACDDGAPAAITPPPPSAVKLHTWVEDWRDEVIYQLLVDRFENGAPGNDLELEVAAPRGYHGGDWEGVRQRLDYLQGLGATTLWISPIVKNLPGGYHGYWTLDFEVVNPNFGTEAELRALVDAAHARGMKVIVDIVVNHVGAVGYYDQDLDGQPDPGEENPGYAREGVRATDGAPAELLFFPEVTPRPALFADEASYNKRGKVLDWNDADQVVNGDFPQGGLKDLRTTSPEVRAELIRIYAAWIERLDIDGFRLDTLKHVEATFWREFAAAMRERAAAAGKERFFLFGEAFDGNYDTLAPYTKNFGPDSVVDFRLKFGGFDDVFGRGGATRTLETIWQDKERKFESLLVPGGAGQPPTKLLVNFLDNHDVVRFANAFPEPGRLRAGLAYLFLYDGIPCVYYGTEQGFAGGEDPSNREDLSSSGFRADAPLYGWIAQLAALRKELEPLRRGELQFRWSTEHVGGEADAGVIAFERVAGTERVLVAINTSGGDRVTSAASMGGGDMQTGFAEGTRLVDRLSAESFLVGAAGKLAVPLGPWAARALVAQ